MAQLVASAAGARHPARGPHPHLRNRTVKRSAERARRAHRNQTERKAAREAALRNRTGSTPRRPSGQRRKNRRGSTRAPEASAQVPSACWETAALPARATRNRRGHRPGASARRNQTGWAPVLLRPALEPSDRSVRPSHSKAAAVQAVARPCRTRTATGHPVRQAPRRLREARRPSSRAEGDDTGGTAHARPWASRTCRRWRTRRSTSDRRCALEALVTEVAGTGEDHRDAVFVGGGDDLCVTHRTARLHHTPCTCGRESVEPITEGEKCV